MSKFTVVEKVPEKLKDTDFVLYKPNFLEEVKASRLSNQSVSKITTVNHLRDILMIITGKYDESINPYHITLNKYEGINVPTSEDIADVIVRIDRDNNLKLLEKALNLNIKNRPIGTEMIYYVSPDTQGVEQFQLNNIEIAKK